MDLKLIRNLVRIMERGEVSELEIDDEKAGLRVHLKRGDSQGAQGHSVVMMPGTGAPTPPPAEAGGEDGAPGKAQSGFEEIQSPMVGTYYGAPSPDAEAFTAVGMTVGEESVVCIIEAMKVMNEIKAEVRGEIVEVLVDNGDPVEFGQPLFLVRPS